MKKWRYFLLLVFTLIIGLSLKVYAQNADTQDKIDTAPPAEINSNAVRDEADDAITNKDPAAEEEDVPG